MVTYTQTAGCSLWRCITSERAFHMDLLNVPTIRTRNTVGSNTQFHVFIRRLLGHPFWKNSANLYKVYTWKVTSTLVQADISSSFQNTYLQNNVTISYFLMKPPETPYNNSIVLHLVKQTCTNLILEKSTISEN